MPTSTSLSLQILDYLDTYITLSPNPLPELVQQIREDIQNGELPRKFDVTRRIREKNELHLKALIQPLEGVAFLTSLCLGYNGLENSAAQILAPYLKNDTILQELDLTGNNLTNEGSDIILGALNSHAAISTIRLAHNPIGDEGGPMIASLLKTAKEVKVLDVASTQLRNMALTAIAIELPSTKIHTLDLSDNLYSSPTCLTNALSHIANAIEHTPLVRLSMAKMSIQDAHMDTLGRAIMLNKTLRILDLRSNQIRSSGEILIHALPNLEQVYLGGNRLWNDGTKHVTELLSKSNIIAIDLRHNNISTEGLYTLAKGLEVSKLKWLWLWGNNFEPISCEVFKQCLDKRPEIKHDMKFYKPEGDWQVAHAELPLESPNMAPIVAK